MDKTLIDICICTFRRAHIVETVRSVASIDVEEPWDVQIIVADNDKHPSAKESVENAGKENPFPLTYIHAPACNISIARNACLQKSRQELVVFIDDDEQVEKNWLKELIARKHETKAQAVLGPVYAIYGEACPAWVKKMDIHSTTPVFVQGEIITGYAGNLLLDLRTRVFKGRTFREDLGQTGGEDSAFLGAAWREGAKIEYAAKAIAKEIIPKERTKFAWMIRRRFRKGQIHGMLLNEARTKNRVSGLKNIMLASAKALFCFCAAPLFFLKRHRFNFWILRGCLHAGVVSYFLSKQTLVIYGQKEK